MKIVLDYQEIQSLIKSKTGREIVLSAIDERTIKAEAKVSVKVPFLGEIEKSIGVNVSVEKIEGNDVHLKYEGVMGTDMIIGGLLTFLSSTPAMKMVEKTQGNGIVVHLYEVEKAREVLNYVELKSFQFCDNGIVLEGQFKSKLLSKLLPLLCSL